MKNSSPRCSHILVHQRLAVVAMSACMTSRKCLLTRSIVPRQHFLGPVAGVPIADPQPQIQHIAGLRQGPVQRRCSVPRVLRTQSPPLPSRPIHFMDRRVPVQRCYLATLYGAASRTHPAVWTPSCLRNSRQSLPTLRLAGRYQSATETCRSSSVRYPVVPQHFAFSASSWRSRLTSCSLFPPLTWEDQGQDMIRFPDTQRRHSYPSVDSARRSEPLAISWRTAAPNLNSSATARTWCSWSTTGGFVYCAPG